METNNEASAATGVQVQGVRRMKRAEIDTRQPFRSVKEAISLFGEKFLAGELYATRLKQMHNGAHETGHGHGNGPASRIGTVTAELEETKQSLQKAREESELMENCLSSLQEELERTNRELRQLKEREYEKHFVEAEIEDVRNIEVEDSTKFEMKTQTSDDEEEGSFEFQKRRYVTFANPPSLAQVKIAQGLGVDAKLERHPSLKKKKKKALIPLIAGMFSKKKGGPQPQVAYP